MKSKNLLENDFRPGYHRWGFCGASTNKKSWAYLSAKVAKELVVFGASTKNSLRIMIFGSRGVLLSSPQLAPLLVFFCFFGGPFVPQNTSPELVPLFIFWRFWGSLCFPPTRFFFCWGPLLPA